MKFDKHYYKLNAKDVVKCIQQKYEYGFIQQTRSQTNTKKTREAENF